MNSNQLHKTLITSGRMSVKAMAEHKKFLGSSYKDYVAEGYKPDGLGKGVLAHWDNLPLAYYDIPTANRMIYPKDLWQALIEHPILTELVATNSFWMENDHKDSDEVLISQVAGRITNWAMTDNNLIIGGVDIMDTVEGLKTFCLSSTGTVGTSTRGFGVLFDAKTGVPVDDLHPCTSGLTRVEKSEYIHVDSDFVANPAVPISRLSASTVTDAAVSAIDRSDAELRDLITNFYNQNPNDLGLAQLYSAVTGEDRVKELQRQQKIVASLRRIK